MAGRPVGKAWHDARTCSKCGAKHARPKGPECERYNGWLNYETWNVALWIGNDEGLYTTARECRPRTYETFVQRMKEFGEECGGGAIAIQTPDGVAWNDSGLDTDALDEMMEEL